MGKLKMSLFTDQINSLIGGPEFYTVFGSNIVRAQILAFSDDMVTLKIFQEENAFNVTMHFSNVTFVTS